MTDTPQLLLAHHLKALKLPTFLREYDKLARQDDETPGGPVRMSHRGRPRGHDRGARRRRYGDARRMNGDVPLLSLDPSAGLRKRVD